MLVLGTSFLASCDVADMRTVKTAVTNDGLHTLQDLYSDGFPNVCLMDFCTVAWQMMAGAVEDYRVHILRFCHFWKPEFRIRRGQRWENIWFCTQFCRLDNYPGWYWAELSERQTSAHSVKLIIECEGVTEKAQPTRWSPIQVLTCLDVTEPLTSPIQLFSHWATGTQVSARYWNPADTQIPNSFPCASQIKLIRVRGNARHFRWYWGEV